MKPSQMISNKDIDAAYDAQHEALKNAMEKITELRELLVLAQQYMDGDLSIQAFEMAVADEAFNQKEHNIDDGANCWCEPEIIGDVIVHRRTDN